ncbi:MAG: Holliday junction branch migration DNA helicase RuvB [Puniceicoccales bacterium]|jgi:Holliday junction DNA helicase RuvB|nr:Holliday junction branch migration DNA helicase RuvB [Puniceicoccales bacterium]
MPQVIKSNINTTPQSLNAKNDTIESSLRPSDFIDFVGQEKTVERLKIMTGAAKKRGEALSHILLSGPPGLGKTTLAMILGQEMGSNIRVTSGPVIEKAGDLAGLLTSLEACDILFIDEIHRVPKAVEEYLYSAMEDFRIDIMIDQGPNARSVSLNLPPFTLVGATTRTGLLSAPLRSRFTLQTRLDYYPREILAKIVTRSAKLLSVKIDPNCANEIASRSRGTPRIANNLLRFVRDFVQQKAIPNISKDVVKAALEMLEIDVDGLDEMDKKILSCMAQNYSGGPVGFGTVAVAVGEDLQTIEEVHEPYLITEGYIQRTAQGRMLTSKGWKKVGLEQTAIQEHFQI